MNETTVICGYISVSAAIRGGKRRIDRIILDTERYNRVVRSKYHYNEKKQYAALKSCGVEIDFLSSDEFS